MPLIYITKFIQIFWLNDFIYTSNSKIKITSQGILMLPKIIFAFTVLLSLSLYAQSIKSYYANNTIQSDTNYKDGTHTNTTNGIKDGIQTFYHQNGQIASVTPYVDGKKEGRHKRFDSEGRLIEIRDYHNGLLDGLVMQRNPVLDFPTHKAMYKEGVRHSKEHFFFPDGNLRKISYYINGIKEASEIKYYPNGKMKSMINYFHGIIDGPARYFDTNGDEVLKVEYKMGKKIKG